MVLLLSACGAAPEKPAGPSQPDTGQARPEQPEPGSLRMPASAFDDLFQQAENALDALDWMRAELVLSELDNSPMVPSTHDLQYRAYLEARGAFERGLLQRASRLLAGLAQQSLAPALDLKVTGLQRHMASLAGDSLTSARLGRKLMNLNTGHEADLKRHLWRELQRTDETRLRAAEQEASDPEWRAWLQLALATRETGSPSARASALQSWLEQYPTHPGASPLPGGLKFLLDAPSGTDRVALLLPLSGRLAPAAKAVKDGYLAAYYAAAQARPDLYILDTDRYPGAAEAYRQAVALGANLVIGPLSKQAVTEIGLLPERPVPVLALNRIDQDLPPSTSPLVQLSLSPEDEARRIAELAFGEGGRRALIVQPRGSWGDKLQQALVERWQQLGGSIAATAIYGDQTEYSSSIEDALDIPAGRARARAVRDMLAENIEYTPRRRQDLDVVFLLSHSGAEARSVKPLLSFHYAGDLPVWGTSALYSGTPDGRDRDLQGVNLVEIPWLLGSSPDLRVAIAAGDTGSDNFARLNALGADAYRLQTGFRRLASGPDLLLRGHTGLLSLDPGQRLLREPTPATFDRGVLIRR